MSGSAPLSDRKSTTTITIRLNTKVMNILRAESKNRDISLNMMINHILQRYVEWDMYGAKIGMISLLKPTVKELFKKLSKQEIVELSTDISKSATNDAALFMKKKMDLDSFLAWLEARMKNSSIETSHNVEGSVHTYILKHDLGENYSFFQKTVLESIFSEVLGIHIDCSFSETLLSFKFSD